MSLKGDKYENAEEVRFRLEGTIVQYEGKPVYITRVGMPDLEEKEIARVYFRALPIGANKEVRKLLSSKNFDLAPVKLGYMNKDGKAYYLARTAVRQNKQGLNSQVLTYQSVTGGHLGRQFDFRLLVEDQCFVDLLNGVYPTFKEVEQMFGNKGITSVAISRCFAFMIDHDFECLYLMHKGVKCGICFKGEDKMTVPPKYRFLKEEMAQFNIPIK